MDKKRKGSNGKRKARPQPGSHDKTGNYCILAKRALRRDL